MMALDRVKHQGWLLAGLLTCSWGCADARPQDQEKPADRPASSATRVDSKTAGTIRGRIFWQGALPAIASFTIKRDPLNGLALAQKRTFPNPNAPLIDPQTRAVAEAIVFLREVELDRAKPWDLPPVVVESNDQQMLVRQGEVARHSGFVRRGDSIEMVSRDAGFYTVHASGAAFFTVPFPEPERMTRRRLNDLGIVELSSAAGSYWQRAYLHVAEHPYYTHTNAAGRFELSQIPPGRYELVCWLPNWQKARHERDPEFAVISRWYFEKPLEKKQTCNVEPGKSGSLEMFISIAEFDR